MQNIVFIFARGGSKGLPRKNIKLLNGKPLISYPIEIAKQLNFVNRIIVSTDDRDIADIAKEHGAEVPFIRPASLAGDQSPEWLAWQHACEFIISKDGEFDTFISLPATAPLRKVDDVSKAFDFFQVNDFDSVITSVEAKFNPYFTLFKKNQSGAIELFSQDESVTRRQDAPKALGIVPVAYVTSPDFILSKSSIWGGSVGAVEVDPLSSIDIDDKFDFYMAELIAKDHKSH